MENITEIMMNLIKSEICQVPVCLSKNLTNQDLKQLYVISKNHDLVHLVAHALIANGLLNDDASIKIFNKEMHKAAFRYLKIDKAKNEICSAFQNAQIPFILLKGSVIRDMYPEPWMRTSCDIDVLVKESNLEKASEILNNNFNYKVKFHTAQDISFYSEKEDLHIELHYNLNSSELKNDIVLKEYWDVAYRENENSFCFAVPDEYFYYYHIAHMAKHFLFGGCGVRPFVDLWLLNNKIDFSPAKRKALLKKGGLDLFEEGIFKLSNVWFGSENHTDLTEQIEEYIVPSNIYGNVENWVYVSQAKKGSKFKQIISRIFLPYNSMKYDYPILQKHKFLLPYFEFHRIISVLFKNSLKNKIYEFNLINSTSAKSLENTTTMLEKLGLK